MKQNKNKSRIVIAAFAGILVGATVGVLTAPEKGKVTRQKIKNEIETKSVQVNDVALQLKQSLAEDLERRSDRIGNLLGSGIAYAVVTAKEFLFALEEELKKL